MPDLLLFLTREYGFFYVRNSGVSPKLVQQHFEQSRAFFQLPLDVKASLTDVRPSDVHMTCVASLSFLAPMHGTWFDGFPLVTEWAVGRDKGLQCPRISDLEQGDTDEGRHEGELQNEYATPLDPFCPAFLSS